MIKYPCLLPECNIDTAFVEMIGYKEPNHAPSITQVSFILENKFSNQRAMGFIDNDKKKTKYIAEFECIDEVNRARLLKHPDRHHYLVVLDPAMDGFIFSLCESLNINPGKYRLPSNRPDFISATKQMSIRSNTYFKNLLNTILQKRPAEFVRIKSWIKKYSPYRD